MWIAYVAIVAAVLTVAALARRRRRRRRARQLRAAYPGLTLVERHLADRNGREWVAAPKKLPAPVQQTANGGYVGWPPPVDSDPDRSPLVEEAMRRSIEEGAAVPEEPRPNPEPQPHHSAPYEPPPIHVSDPAPYDPGPSHESSHSHDSGGSFDSFDSGGGDSGSGGSCE